jgi:hypothetical protein
MENEVYSGIDFVAISNGIVKQLDDDYYDGLSTTEPFSRLAWITGKGVI